MRTETKALSVLLLLVPMVLGGAATQRLGASHKTATIISVTTPPTNAVTQTALEETSQSDNALTPAASANPSAYAMDWYSINGGGTTTASSVNYKLGVSVGQSAAGAAASTNCQMGMGFWYGVGGGCACPCKYAPECDGVISDVLDVTRTINVAFRGQADTQDPGCPVEGTDVDASTATDVLDVAKVINVAFRGQQAASNYVDPCL